MFFKTMEAKDVLSGAQGECYVTINGERYNFMQAYKLEAKVEKQKVEIAILGRTSRGNKSVGTKGTGTATFRYNTSIFRELMYRYQNTGEDLYFDIQITNEDAASAAGRQTVILRDCNLNSVIVAKFDADSQVLDEDMDFTFERFELPEKFKPLAGMK